MRLPPDSVIATWPMPNYVNPQSRGSAGNVVGVILISVVSVLLVLRIYTRQYISYGWGLDDVLIILAYFPATAFEILGMIGDTQLHWDRHIWDIEPDAFVPSLKLAFANFLLFDAATTLTKLSTLAMIHRLTTASTDRWMNRVVLGLAGLISLDGVLFMFVTTFQCRPVYAYWTLSETPQQCIDEGAHLLSAGIINTITDFVLVFLPIKTVVNLQLPHKQQLVVLILFCAGFLAGIAGIVRTYYTWLMTDAPNFDKQWYAWAAWVASGVELYIGIVCASIPSIKPFFTKYLPNVIDSTLRSRSNRMTLFPNSREPKSFRFSTSIKGFTDRPESPAGLLQPQVVTPFSPYTSNDVESVNLDKPSPVVETTERGAYQQRSRFSEDLSFSGLGISNHSPLNRGGVRFSNRSSLPFFAPSTAGSEDRTTVLIMLQDSINNSDSSNLNDSYILSDSHNIVQPTSSKP